MSAIQINLIMIGLILVGLILIAVAYKKLRPWVIWLTPVILLLLHGLVYSVTYISDAMTLNVNPLLYNAWNNWLRAQSYLTIIFYVTAFLLLLHKLNGENKK